MCSDAKAAGEGDPMQWQIGDVKITLVREMQTTVELQGMFPESDRSVVDENVSWLKPHFLNDDGTLPLSIHALVLESQGQVIMVDTCVGERPVPGFDAMSFMNLGFLSTLAAAGYTPDDIDIVLCTHLHFDHVGWNTHLVDGKWVPTFPNARYLFARVEYEHWDTGAEGAAVTFGDAVRPVLEAGLADLVEMDHVVNDEIRLEPTPGHSPGHVSVRISSNGEEAVITGDMVHHPVQFVAPQWRMSADGDPARATETRIDFRSRYASSGVRVFGTHFGGPSTGFLQSTPEGYRFTV
jgi:glyoxylase-like metal-dependent hydrolase (beta-lactamase superfamily II)